LKTKKFDVILTGGAGYIGSKIADFLQSKGKTVAILDLSLGHDLTNESFTKDWFSKNHSKFLINCFAIDDRIITSKTVDTFLDVELSEVLRYFQVNTLALLSVCREFIRNQNSGGIINFSSIYSTLSPRNDIYNKFEKNIGYGLSKAAVNQLSRHLAVHAAPNFLVNSIILGGVLNSQSTDFVSNYSRNVPLKRMATPSDVFGLIEYLCSDLATYTTGADFVVDGGWTAW
jgi:NAD(P)-dependent dehydrogenase (short-subunit alcohol dehydrogenase family)